MLQSKSSTSSESCSQTVKSQADDSMAASTTMMTTTPTAAPSQTQAHLAPTANALICSQNFSILPALLAWLRAPHHKLHARLERLLLVVAFVLFTAFLPRLALRLGRCARAHVVGAMAARAARMRAITLAVYAALAAVLLQLVACVYCLVGVAMPTAGWVFMCASLCLITQMNFSCLRSFLREESATRLVDGRQVPVQRRLSRRDILGRRTISNMSLI